MLVGEIDGHYRLKDVIDQVRRKYDFIFIDTPPTLGLITVNALVASDVVLIPIQSSYLSLEGTDDLLETIDKINTKFGSNTIRYASTGFKRSHKMRQEKLSPKFTTDWNELPVVK